MRGLLAAALALLGGCAFDPAPSIWTGKGDSRSMSCTRLTQAQAHERYPGLVPELPPRGFASDTDALACERLFMVDGEREARDEAILSHLRAEVAELTQVATARHPQAALWHVDAFYPDPAMASRLAVAAKVELVERGKRVSDRAPVLAAGDIAVLSRMEPKEAYPLTCARYFAEKALGEGDVFLGLMLVDARETSLHAGLCEGAQWRWLR